MCLKIAHIHWPRELEVIQKLKPFHVIFSHTTIIIGCHKMSYTPTTVFMSNNVPKWKSEKITDEQRWMFSFEWVRFSFLGVDMMWEVMGRRERRGRKKSLKKNRKEKRKGKKMRIVWLLKMTKRLIHIIKKYQGSICTFLKIRAKVYIVYS